MGGDLHKSPLAKRRFSWSQYFRSRSAVTGMGPNVFLVASSSAQMPYLPSAEISCLDETQIVAGVRHWLEGIVIALNLCPFARPQLVKNRVRIVATQAMTEEQLLLALQAEIELLDQEASLETTLLAHPQVLADFADYNQFLNLADELLVQLRREGVYQVASFHPGYQFDGTSPDDAENFTNRSPYPLLHILREDSLERAITDFPDVEQIPLRNIELMNRLGRKKLQNLLLACVSDAEQG